MASQEPNDFIKGGVLLAKEYEKVKSKKPITEYWASEKYDGCRAIWDGEKFVSRNNKTVFLAPPWFKECMPKGIVLDGELWTKRDDFDNCGFFRKKTPAYDKWTAHEVKYKIFDAPLIDEPFEGRMKHIANVVKMQKKIIKAFQNPVPHNPLSITKQIKIKDQDHLDLMFKEITTKKGEGLMLREAGSYYEQKRSNTLLKMKPVNDEECEVIGYKPGTGKYKGMLGSFRCRLLSDPNIEFNLSGMDDNIRRNYNQTHPLGTVLTVQFNDKTKKGVPRFPRYLRIRHDNDF